MDIADVIVLFVTPIVIRGLVKPITYPMNTMKYMEITPGRYVILYWIVNIILGGLL